MIEQDVTQLSESLGIPKEIIVASDKEGTLSTRIGDALKKNYTDNKTLETFKKNYKDEVINEYFTSLVEGAKKGDVPQELYKPIKGAALQQKERDIAKKYEISEYGSIDDLVDKAVSKTTANGKPTPEFETKINELKTANLQLQKEKEDAIKTAEKNFTSRILERDKADLISQIPFDFTGVKPEDIESKRAKTQNILKSVFDAEYTLDYDDKQRLVVMKDGKILRNSATLDPVPAKDVIMNVANEYSLKLISPDKGGQGGESSRQNSAGFHDYESFKQWCISNNYKETSREAVSAWAKSGLKA